MTTILRQILALLVLVPQLALGGAGGGFVLCASPGDHLQLELAESACCVDRLERPAAETPGSVAGVPTPRPDCPACEDVALTIDPAIPAHDGPELHATHCVAPSYLLREGPVGRAVAALRSARTTPAHVARLRSTLLRC